MFTKKASYFNILMKRLVPQIKALSHVQVLPIFTQYIVVEDYITNNFDKTGDYSEYEGAQYTRLLKRQKELPFGKKLQNHALNNRMNAEFQKFFPNSEYIPILRNLETKRYLINENLLKIKIGKSELNISNAIIEIVDEYIKTKQGAFQRFVEACEELQKIGKKSPNKVEEFIIGLLASNVDARLFEIVSYSILKYFYHDQQIIWGYEMESLNKEHLTLYKTGRTNANDGGIDFVMKPLGRFFQVTETLDFKKYFLDIDKTQKYPITFVIKTSSLNKDLLNKIRDKAKKTYGVNSIVNKYMDYIEEVINIPTLEERFKSSVKQGYLNKILSEIILQSKIEFNYEDLNDDEE